MTKQVIIHEKKRLLDTFFKVDEITLQFEKCNGELSETVKRLCFERGDCVAVLIYNTDTQKFILTRQFRYPTYSKDGGWIYEIPAGKIDAGETPFDAVKRETLEETGYQIEWRSFINKFYLSPGGSSEAIYLYYTEVTEADKIAPGGGLASEQEDVEIFEYDFEELQSLIDGRGIIDAKTLLAFYWYKAAMYYR